MQRRHQLLLSNNHEFLISEIPMDAVLEVIRGKRILSWHDFEQMKTLRHQGRRAIARYFLAVLPYRGCQAFQAFLESLQEANCQHLVDLLLQQAGAVTLDELLKEDSFGAENTQSNNRGPLKTPTDTPLPLIRPDPHEYAVKLTRNARFIQQFVDPAHISPLLAQNKVLTAREADMVTHLNGRYKKWELIMAALLQRGERAFQAFMAALLQKDYSTVFHAIQETSTDPSSSNDDDFEDNGTNMESDEEIKEETVNFRKKNRPADELLLRDSTTASTNVSSSDDILLTKSRDLMNIEDDVRQLPADDSKNSNSLQDIKNNDSSGYDDEDNNNMRHVSKYSDVNNGDELNKQGQRGISNSSILNSVHEDVEY
uniref:CARD domain-containing protein n=1 Tax=Arion vulgaris TaxID=1028688 RepID=A0A0B7AXV0_9EUPU